MKDVLTLNKDIKLKYVTIEEESFYMISNSDAMRPFFMSIVSDSNHWMFISSNGGLTAGRVNSENALFPYYTDDKITELHDITGSKTIFWVQFNGQSKLWEPFSERNNGLYKCTRNLYKGVLGNKILFEEINHDLGLIFRYQWCSSNQFGFVRKSTVINSGNTKTRIRVLDGIQNIMPYGAGTDLQAIRSNLVDAYKRNELDEETGLGIYALSAIIVDRAEPSEALKANIVWSLGLENPKHILSSIQLKAFRQDHEIMQENDIKAEKGAYLAEQILELNPNTEKQWTIIANVNQTTSNIVGISERIKNDKNLINDIYQDVEKGSKRLLKLTSASDGLQLTADKRRNARHYSNTLFNIMRGGIFDNNYQIEKWDFINYISAANRKVLRTNEGLLNALPELVSLQTLKELAYKSADKNFRRLALEYMPLKFSRRHGDPSRPWNKFSINTRNEIDGSKILDYEGNWRDIFQNWEALAHSYPEFIESMIHKFLNASTFDGYNPYRVTKGGFDWEVIEEHDPWSYIGYWGDHQIIYLLKFLEFIQDHYPNKLSSFFDEDFFVYANVPYKIKPYQDLLANPKDTIVFDYDLDSKIREKRSEFGADGALLRDENYYIHKVNFIEKILATVLAKLSNFIPEAGIWLNTQRPEWNDANNALVGNGVSMVTLYYLRRFFSFFNNILSAYEDQKEIEISTELYDFFTAINTAFVNNESMLTNSISDKDRKQILDSLGVAGSNYREQIYKHAFSGRKKDLKIEDLIGFTALTLKYLDHSISANKRNDNMYHAYNLMTLKNENEISISYLDEMLEGQVAVLSSGYLDAANSLNLLDALKHSKLFRPDQFSYLLYPNKELLGFFKKNNIPKDKVEKSALLTKLIQDGNTKIIERDINGNYHFNGNFNNAESLKNALHEIATTEYSQLVEKDKDAVLQIFELVFNHKAFTGRSGTFYGYEGLGSIYWHMVSKLALASKDVCINAINNQQNEDVIGRLLEHYYEINEGIGVHKSPLLYGAFPIDPYSHTPAGKGAQQPGMTGQVKEDVLCRIGELGVSVKNGRVRFNPCLLRIGEFLKSETVFNYIDVFHNDKSIQLQENTLAFTYCQVPIVYQIAKETNIEIFENNTVSKIFNENQLDKESSQKLFNRTGEITMIKVKINKRLLK